MRRFIYAATSLCLVIVLHLIVTQPAHGAQNLRDISGNWAAEHIRALVDKGIISGYPNGTFGPNKPVTRAEFAKVVVKAFDLPKGTRSPLRDVKEHWATGEIAALHQAKLIEGYEDHTFRPNRTITRAEVVAIIVRVLKLNSVANAEKVDTTSFSDVSGDHWAAGAVSAAERLDILPPYFRGRFRPSDPATRAETAALVNSVLRLQVADGTVDYNDATQLMLSVKTTTGTLRDFSVSPAVLIYRNGSFTQSEALRKGDTVHVVADRFGTPVYVVAQGAATSEEVANRVSTITRGILTPEQLRAAIRGDWNAVAGGFQVTLYNQLLDVGATPLEADAIMQKDWASLSLLGRDRLSQALGQYMGISSDLTTALLDQDWAQAKKLAEVEATQAILSRLLFGANAS